MARGNGNRIRSSSGSSSREHILLIYVLYQLPSPAPLSIATQFSPNKITMAAATPPRQSPLPPPPETQLTCCFCLVRFFDVNLISVFTFWGFPLSTLFSIRQPPLPLLTLFLSSCLSQCPPRLLDHIRNASFNVDIAAAHQPRRHRHLCLVSLPLATPLLCQLVTHALWFPRALRYSLATRSVYPNKV